MMALKIKKTNHFPQNIMKVKNLIFPYLYFSFSFFLKHPYFVVAKFLNLYYFSKNYIHHL